MWRSSRRWWRCCGERRSALAVAFPALAKAIGYEDWIDDPVWEVPEALLPRLDRQEREKWRGNPPTMQAP